jgi:hypothetical protein
VPLEPVLGAPMEQQFKSKVDTWLVLLVVVPMVIVVAVVGGVAGDSLVASRTTRISVIVPLVLGFGLPLWLFLSTSYTVSTAHLTVRSGPFRIVVPIASITRVAATRSIESAPALSLDRLAVEYGTGKRVLISPSDKAGFLKALAMAGVDATLLVATTSAR